MKNILKSFAVGVAVLTGSVSATEAHARHGTQVYVEVYRVPYGDWLNVRQWPSPSAPKVARLFNGAMAVVDLKDCWDARYDRRIALRDVYFNAPGVWCGIRAGHHGRVRGYVRASFIHAE